jgi:hypothetical protein
VRDVYNVHNKLPDDVPELQPYHKKIYYIQLDEETQHHVYVHTLTDGVFRFKKSLSFIVNYFNKRNCKFEKVTRFSAVNLEKLTGYGRDNAIYGPWWADLGPIRVTINKRCYKHFNKSEYRHLNKSVTLRKRSFFR